MHPPDSVPCSADQGALKAADQAYHQDFVTLENLAIKLHDLSQQLLIAYTNLTNANNLNFGGVPRATGEGLLERDATTWQAVRERIRNEIKDVENEQQSLWPKLDLDQKDYDAAVAALKACEAGTKTP
jgi:hypothetical protein